MTSRTIPPGRRALAWLVALLAALPLLLFAYLGQFSRPMGDDYARFATAEQLGGRSNFLHWWNNWDGSYAGILFHDLIAPLGAPSVARFFPTAVLALWWLGICWLIWLATPQLQRYRFVISVGLASLITGAAVKAFYAWESIYWYTACVDNTLPAGGLLITLAFVSGYGKRARPRRLSWVAAVVFFACFVIGGFSEMHAVYQVAVLGLMLLGVFAFDTSPHRRARLVLLAGGCCAAAAALLTQLSAPGVAYRISSAATVGGLHPIRPPVDLARATLETSLKYVGRPASIAGFSLMLAAGMALALRFDGARSPLPSDRPLTLPRAPLMLSLLMQIGFAPALWRAISQNGLSGGATACTNAAALASLLLSSGTWLFMLWRRDCIAAWLSESPDRAAWASAGVLSYALALAALAQLPGAALATTCFLFVSAIAWLGILLALLTSSESEAQSRLLRRAACLSLLAAAIAIALPVVTGLYFNGVVYDRVMPLSALIQVLAGLLWGLCIGASLRRALPCRSPRRAWRTRFQRAALLVTAGIALGIVGNQMLLAPKFATYAREWDARHQRIIQLRGAGETHIEAAPFSFDMTAYIAANGQPIGGSAAYYYRVESIEVIAP